MCHINQNNLFLQGPQGSGKSYLLYEALRSMPGLAGFATQKLVRDGAVCAFRAVIVKGGLPALEAPFQTGLDGVFIQAGGRDVSVLENLIGDVLQGSKRARLIVLDEIGGIELTSPRFMQPLQQLLTGPVPCIGVFKSRDNLLGMSKRMQLPQEYPALHARLEELLQDTGRLLNYMGREDRQAQETVRFFLKHILDSTAGS